jgi:hypothetical protein
LIISEAEVSESAKYYSNGQVVELVDVDSPPKSN